MKSKVLNLIEDNEGFQIQCGKCENNFNPSISLKKDLKNYEETLKVIEYNHLKGIFSNYFGRKKAKSQKDNVVIDAKKIEKYQAYLTLFPISKRFTYRMCNNLQGILVKLRSIRVSEKIKKLFDDYGCSVIEENIEAIKNERKKC